jgi:hypothetical protein
MKKIMMICFFTAASFATMAQVQRTATPSKQRDTVTGNMKADDKMGKKEMFRELNLSKEQRGKMKEINQSNKAKKEAVQADEKLTDAEKKQKLRAIQKQHAIETQSVLNDEQKQKWKELRQQKRAGKAGEMDTEMDN